MRNSPNRSFRVMLFVNFKTEAKSMISDVWTMVQKPLLSWPSTFANCKQTFPHVEHECGEEAFKSCGELFKSVKASQTISLGN